MSRDALDEHRLRRLIDVGRSLVSELDPEAVLHEVVSVARELTGARYAALGILDEDRQGLERFIYLGIDEETRAVIGDLPRGHGVLGLLIEDPKPLRLKQVGEHPRSYGFPAGHPPMSNFLGVPIIIRGEAFGNLYLTEKVADDFNEADEQALTILAEWAAIAIDNARLNARTEARLRELQRAVHGLEATTEIARAIGAQTDLEPVLETIAQRGRALVEARSLLILLQEGRDLVVAASAGEQAAIKGRRIPVEGSMTGEVLRSLEPERVPDIATRLRISTSELGIDGQSAILVPLSFQGRALGVICALDRLQGGSEFDDEDERLLTAFAASAATAVATAQSVSHERQRQRIRATEQERGRWARELHDETLQGLAARRVILSSALQRGGGPELEQAVRDTLEQMTADIENLRGLISELRPATLDEIGLAAALEGLAERVAAATGAEVHHEVSIDPGSDDAPLDPELQTTVYRVVQEALTNVGKHARATRVELKVTRNQAQLELEISDDGTGFDVGLESAGFGLPGMMERVELVGGDLQISSDDESGTQVRAMIPLDDSAQGGEARRLAESA